jgi:hypothetical protein
MLNVTLLILFYSRYQFNFLTQEDKRLKDFNQKN